MPRPRRAADIRLELIPIPTGAKRCPLSVLADFVDPPATFHLIGATRVLLEKRLDVAVAGGCGEGSPCPLSLQLFQPLAGGLGKRAVRIPVDETLYRGYIPAGLKAHPRIRLGPLEFGNLCPSLRGIGAPGKLIQESLDRLERIRV